MSKFVYLLLIVALATLITAKPAEDKKPADQAKDAAKGATKDGEKELGDESKKAKDAVGDLAKGAEDAGKGKKKDSKPDIVHDVAKIAGDFETVGKDMMESFWPFK